MSALTLISEPLLPCPELSRAVALPAPSSSFQ